MKSSFISSLDDNSQKRKSPELDIRERRKRYVERMKRERREGTFKFQSSPINSTVKDQLDFDQNSPPIFNEMDSKFCQNNIEEPVQVEEAQEKEKSASCPEEIEEDEEQMESVDLSNPEFDV